MPTFDGVEYACSKRFDSDEAAEAFLEKTYGDRGVSKADMSIVNGYLTLFWTPKAASDKTKFNTKWR